MYDCYLFICINAIKAPVRQRLDELNVNKFKFMFFFSINNSEVPINFKICHTKLLYSYHCLSKIHTPYLKMFPKLNI